MTRSLRNILLGVRVLSIALYLMTLFIYVELAFFNSHENVFLYEKIEFKAPYPDNIQGLRLTPEYFGCYSKSKDCIVMQNNVPLKKIAWDQFRSGQDLLVYVNETEGLFFKKRTMENGPVELYTFRPILKMFTLPFLFIWTVLLLVGYDILKRIPSSFRTALTRECDWCFYVFLTLVPLVATLVMIYETPLLGGGQADAAGYTYLSFCSLEEIAGSLRTPGYPCFLALMRMFSPMGLYSAYFFQALIYLGGLSYLIFALCRLGVNRYLGLLLLFLFQFYFYDFHANILADSLGLSGLVLLTACAIHCGLCSTESKKIKVIILLCLIGGICFSQLMVKPFPGTILIASIIWGCVCWGRMPFKKVFWGLMLSFLVCILPAFSYCTYRYVKFGNFNFASLANISMSVQNIAMCNESIFQNDNVSDASKNLIRYLVAQHKQRQPKNPWPMVIDEAFSNGTYATFVNSFWFHCDYLKYLKASSPWVKAFPDIVNWDNAAAPYARELMWQVPLSRRFSVLQSYWRAIGKIKAEEKYDLKAFYPFTDYLYWITLILPCILLLYGKIYCLLQKKKQLFPQVFDFRIAVLLLIITFVVPFCFLSTTFLIAPFCEIRRELIGLWGYYFGWIGLSFYLSCSGFLALIFFLIVPMVKEDTQFWAARKKIMKLRGVFGALLSRIEKYGIDRVFAFVFLSSLLFYSYFYIPERISFLISSDQDITIHIRARNFWLKSQQIVLEKSASPKFVSLFFNQGFFSKLRNITISSPADSKTSLHAMQIVTGNGNYEYFHGKIQKVFSLSHPEKIQSVDTKYGITFLGSQDLTPIAERQMESGKLGLNRQLPDLTARIFPHWTSGLKFSLFFLGIFLISCRIRTIGWYGYVIWEKIAKRVLECFRRFPIFHKKTGL